METVARKFRREVSKDVFDSFGYGGFDSISDMFRGIDRPVSRRQNSTRKRKRDFAIERSSRITNGEAPISSEEIRNNEFGLDVFGQPINYKSNNSGY